MVTSNHNNNGYGTIKENNNDDNNNTNNDNTNNDNIIIDDEETSTIKIIHNNKYNNNNDINKNRVTVVVLSIIALLFGAAVVSTGWMTAYTTDGEAMFTEEDLRKSSKKEVNDYLTFTLQREGYDALPYFTDEDYVFTYKFLKDYVAVIEPSSTMYLTILEDSSYVKGDYYKFKVYDSDSNKVTHGKSNPNANEYDTLSISCSPYETYYISVTKYNSDNQELLTADGEAVCMYVRREVRELTTDDLNAVLDAMYTLWETPQSKGQLIYGENYHDAEYFSQVHNYNAAWKDADHIHEGLGFVPQHIKITNMYETAIQSVDPSVSLFYWDFTIESSAGEFVFDSYIFTEDVFGSIYKPTSMTTGWKYSDDDIDNARIQDGRWKDLKAVDYCKYDELLNGYGYMRGPWNMNPSKYITRFSSNFPDLPECNDYKEWIYESDFSAFMKLAPYGPHSTTHSAIGGVYGCDVLDAMLEKNLIKDSDAVTAICLKWPFWLKEMYRGDYLSTETGCSVKEKNCKFVCNSEKLDDLLAVIKDTITLSAYTPGNLTDSDWETWRDFICTGDGNKIFVGDHLESASPADPSFWPIHPTGERLLHAKFMVGGFDEFAWPTSAKGTDYVCNHPQCYEYDDADKDYYELCCYGHYENDQLMDFVSGNRSVGFGPTNKEILDGTDAGSKDYNMPYIYAHFDWDHCHEDFSSIGKTLLQSSNSRKRRVRI